MHVLSLFLSFHSSLLLEMEAYVFLFISHDKKKKTIIKIIIWCNYIGSRVPMKIFQFQLYILLLFYGLKLSIEQNVTIKIVIF